VTEHIPWQKQIDDATGALEPQPATEQAKRYDKGKNRLGLMSIPALWEIGQVYTMGAAKYADRNWEKGMPYTKTMDAALRHIFKWLAGHRNDEESGLHHLAHAAWNLIALLHYELGNYDMGLLDDRSLTSKHVPNSSEAPTITSSGQGDRPISGLLTPQGSPCPCPSCEEKRNG
jgi:hypothetical protein